MTQELGQQIEHAIETLVSLLDTVDGDENLENTDDDEPYLSAGSQTWNGITDRPPFVLDCELDEGERALRSVSMPIIYSALAESQTKFQTKYVKSSELRHLEISMTRGFISVFTGLADASTARGATRPRTRAIIADTTAWIAVS